MRLLGVAIVSLAGAGCITSHAWEQGTTAKMKELDVPACGAVGLIDDGEDGDNRLLNLAAVNQWTTIEFDLTQEPDYRDPMCAVPFNPNDIREVGVQFDSNSAAMSPEMAVVLIDDVKY